MIVAMIGTKGGVGKSILGTNLAVLLAQQGDVLLLDADRQGSGAGWAGLREEAELVPRVSCVQRFGKLHRELEDLERRYGVVVVDTGGRDAEEARSALLAADLAILPMLPAQFDLWALEQTAEMIETARIYNEGLQVMAVFNRASTHPAEKEVREAREYLESLEITLAESVVRDRRAFRRAASEGRGVGELRPLDAKASAEIWDLFREVIPDAVQAKTA